MSTNAAQRLPFHSTEPMEPEGEPGELEALHECYLSHRKYVPRKLASAETRAFAAFVGAVKQVLPFNLHYLAGKVVFEALVIGEIERLRAGQYAGEELPARLEDRQELAARYLRHVSRFARQVRVLEHIPGLTGPEQVRGRIAFEDGRVCVTV